MTAPLFINHSLSELEITRAHWDLLAGKRVKITFVTIGGRARVMIGVVDRAMPSAIVNESLWLWLVSGLQLYQLASSSIDTIEVLE